MKNNLNVTKQHTFWRKIRKKDSNGEALTMYFDHSWVFTAFTVTDTDSCEAGGITGPDCR